MTPEEQLFSELETGYRLLKGPPVPTLLPQKGIGFFFEGGKARFYVLSKFNNSDTTLRTPVTFKNAMKLLWNIRRT